MLLELAAVSKSYGSAQVLEPTDLGVADGEFLTILGPSGSGKTTILRMVAGFTQPTVGRIRYAGGDITHVPTHKRPFNTVFQDYALFPHMSVARNVGYGLMLRGTPKREVARKVQQTLELVGLTGFLDRYPAQLSGGQRQRVALARAIICEPKLVLLDEPLAALDAELRRQMQLFLKNLQRRIRTTFLFVTHDQEEATTMSDRIVVMNFGRIEQIGAPKDIYYHPKSRFVAGFFGDNNLLDGRADGSGRLVTAFGAVPAPHLSAGSSATLAIRPEKLALDSPVPPDCGVAFRARVEDVVFVGAITQVLLRPEARPELLLTAKLTSGSPRGEFVTGQLVDARVGAADIAIVP
jgi:ABC-type Fe3+/spermidine/putrescine transport system ATPase subunit